MGLVVWIVLILTPLWALWRTFAPNGRLKKKSIKGQTVLVTGAANGFGRLIAEKLLRLEPANLVIWDRDEKGLAEVERQLRAATQCTKVHSVVVDLSDREAVYEAAAKTNKWAGRVQILINNAGIVKAGNFLEIEDDVHESILDINTKALFWTTKAFLPAMYEHDEGHILNVASVAGIVGAAGLASYSASKWAVLGFTETLDNEAYVAGKKGIRFSTVCPYYSTTRMLDQIKLTNARFVVGPEEVAETTVDALLTERRLVVYPRQFHVFLALRRLIPYHALQYALYNVLDSRADAK